MAEKKQVSRHSVGFFVLVRSLSCAYSYENVTIIKRSLLKSVFIIGDGVLLTPMVLGKLLMECLLEWARNSLGKEGDLNFLLGSLH